MSEHITFSEMESFLQATDLSPRFMQEAARIARHTAVCGDCARQYRTLLEVQQLPLDARLRLTRSAGQTETKKTPQAMP